MKICLIGGAGFIGTNLALHLSKTEEVTIIDREDKIFSALKSLNLPIHYKAASFYFNSDFDSRV
jgi:UDP-glucose 4-epimerase